MMLIMIDDDGYDSHDDDGYDNSSNIHDDDNDGHDNDFHDDDSDDMSIPSQVINSCTNLDELGMPSIITSYNAKPVLIRRTG